MEKINSESLDLTKLNIEKLKELFPNAVTEGKIDFDVLRTVSVSYTHLDRAWRY